MKSPLLSAILLVLATASLLNGAEKKLPPLPVVLEQLSSEGDKKKVSGVAMNLGQVLARAAQVSPSLKTAKLEVDRMMRRLYGVKLKYYPEFRVEVEAPRVFDYKVDQVEDSPGNGSQDFYYRTYEPGTGVQFVQHLPTNTDLTANYEHDISSRGILSDRLALRFSQELVRKDPIWLEKTLAAKQVWLEKQAQAAVDREFRYQVASAYYAAVETKLILDNAVIRFEGDRKFAEESEAKYKAGIIAEYSVLDYRRDFEQARSKMVLRQSAFERARNELLYILQLPFDSRVTFEDVPEPKVDPVLCDPRRMVDAGIRSKLQIAQLRYNLFSNEENLSFLRNSFLPSVKLQAGAEWWKTIGDAELNPAVELQGRDLSAGVLISMPLFGEQFRTGNDIMIERLDRTINETNIQDQFLVTVKNTFNSLSTIKELKDRHKISSTILDISSRDFELAKLRFEVGNVGSFDIIRSKNEYYGALDDLITLRFTLLRRLAEIERDYPFLPEASTDER